MPATAARITTDTHWPVLAAMSAMDRRRVLPVLARDPWVGELAIDNPLLFFLLVRIAGEHKLDLRKIQLMARMRRSTLLSLLRCDGSSSTERFLRRCGFLRLDVLEHTAMMALVTQPLPNWARHWRVPHLGLLTTLHYENWQYGAAAMDAVLRDDPTMVMPDGTRIATEHLRGESPKPLAGLILNLREVERLVDMIEDPRAQQRERLALGRCNTMGRVNWLHNDLADRDQEHWSKYVLQRVVGHVWPAAPVAGSETIVPVTTATMLIEEGYRMHHCIPTYVDEILARRGFVYRVLAPERATLFIVPGKDGRWRRKEMKLVCNGTVSKETLALVDEWLEAGQRGGAMR